MDERLEAGRLHLSNGEQAVRQGYPDDARMYFEAALLQFRGPELRLGEAHALRGLAQVAMVNGEPAEAERFARGAVAGYRELVQQLDRIDSEGISDGMKNQGRMGEAAALVLLGEVLVRRGAREDARTALSHARVLGSKLGHFDAVAGVWNMLARLAMREGRYVEARDSMDRALGTYRENRSVDGEVATLLLIAEVERLRGDFDAARQVLAVAEPRAGESSNPMWEGRVLAASGALALQLQDLDSAESYYDLALPLVRSGGDHEMEGYCLVGLGQVASRLGRDDALTWLIDGGRVLAELDHRHGFAGAMLRVSEHALKMAVPELALVAAEAARRSFQQTDPVRGVGQAGRLLVKSLAALEAWQGVLAVAAWRVDVVGKDHRNANEVLAFYRSRAPKRWWAEISAMSSEERARCAKDATDQALVPALERMGASPGVLSSLTDTIALVDSLVDELSGYDLGDSDDDTEVHDRAEVLRAQRALANEGDAVLVLGEDDHDAGFLFKRAPSEFDERSAGAPDPEPEPSDAPDASLDRYLVTEQASLDPFDDSLLIVEGDSKASS